MIDLHILQQLARGGGGGSGGGGGGGGSSGGGSGGGGGGGILGFFFILGYLPVSWTVGSKKQPVRMIAGVVVAILVTIGCAVIAKGWSILTGIGSLCGFVGGSTGFNGMMLTQIKVAKQKLSTAASKDKAWDEASLRAHVEKVFMDYQTDWSTFNYKHMQTYLEPEYLAHMQLVLQAMHALGRRNFVQDPHLNSMQFTNINDINDNENDSFEVLISAQAHDQLLDENDNDKQIYVDSSSWEERWVFNRAGNDWRLQNIYQLTAKDDVRTADLQNFAQKNGFFYNADFGWLLLPQKGQLFSKASFKNSDVNNHVIGLYKNTLVEFYSYKQSRMLIDVYTIAQIVLPKHYGSILVHRKGVRGQSAIGVSKLNHISMEGMEFNDKYDVYADDVEQVTSFELLHPAFMVKLIDLPYEINIEVTDNIVYLYTTDGRASYDDMMNLVKQAFDELKL